MELSILEEELKKQGINVYLSKMALHPVDGEKKEFSQLFLIAKEESIAVDKNGIVRIDDNYLDIKYCNENEFLFESNRTTENKRYLLSKLYKMLNEEYLGGRKTMIYHEVGEVFYHGVDKVKTIEISKDEFRCKDCYFNNHCCVMNCRANQRKDEKYIKFIKIEETAENNGGSTDYYKLPAGATELQDLIEHKDMGFGIGNIFKAAYRLGNCEHSNRVRDLNKIIWFARRELKRIKES